MSKFPRTEGAVAGRWPPAAKPQDDAMHGGRLGLGGNARGNIWLPNAPEFSDDNEKIKQAFWRTPV